MQDETVVRALLGVAGSSDRDNTHGWWPVSSLARSFIRSVVGRSPARSFTGSLSRSLGRSVALSLVLSAALFPPSLDRSAARSSARLVALALVTSLSFFLVRSFARVLACERWLARSLSGSVPCALVRFRTYVLARVRTIVRSRSVARPFVRSLARSLVRSATRYCGWGIQFPRGPHSEECILKVTAARSPVKLLI